MTITIRCKIGGSYVTAKRAGDKRIVRVTNAFDEPIEDAQERERALRAVLNELSDLRAWIWHEELKQP